LPSTASPLATRLSLGTSLTTTLELPEQSFIRPYSVDSPTLYDFPPTPANPFTPAARFSQEHTLTEYVLFCRGTYICFNSRCSYKQTGSQTTSQPLPPQTTNHPSTPQLLKQPPIVRI
jgi:hypothetical protein